MNRHGLIYHYVDTVFSIATPINQYWFFVFTCIKSYVLVVMFWQSSWAWKRVFFWWWQWRAKQYQKYSESFKISLLDWTSIHFCWLGVWPRYKISFRLTLSEWKRYVDEHINHKSIFSDIQGLLDWNGFNVISMATYNLNDHGNWSSIINIFR